jgi:hypothetical protein
MPGLIVSVIEFLILLAVIAILIYIAQLILTDIPARVWQLVYLIMFLLVLLWAFTGGFPLPAWRRYPG